MEIPAVLKSELGNEEVYAGVSLGDDDVLALTPSRTLVYRGERLLSNESVESYPHDVERLSVSEGRRKTKFVFEYVDGERALKVPVGRTETVLEHLVEAILRAHGVIEDDEGVAGAFRFSELTFIVTEKRVIKRIGNAVWVVEDFETYDFADVTGLAFEQGSVATQIVIEVGGRPERIKAPNDDAPLVERTLTNALTNYHDVASLAEFERQVEAAAEETTGGDDAARGTDDSDIEFGSGIDPLVSSRGADDDETSREEGSGSVEPSASTESGVSSGDPLAGGDESGGESTAGRDSGGQPAGSRRTGGESQDDPDRPQSSGGARPESGSADEPGAPGDGADGAPDDGEHGSATDVNERSVSAPEDPSAGSIGATGGDGPNPDAAWPDDSASETSPLADANLDTGLDEQEGDLDTGLDEPTAATATREDVQALTAQVAELADTVEHQTELLEKQHRAIKLLLNEVREE